MQELDEIYSCRFCNHVKRDVGFENLTPEEEENFLIHLSTIHGISR